MCESCQEKGAGLLLENKLDGQMSTVMASQYVFTENKKLKAFKIEILSSQKDVC